MTIASEPEVEAFAIRKPGTPPYHLQPFDAEQADRHLWLIRQAEAMFLPRPAAETPE